MQCHCLRASRDKRIFQSRFGSVDGVSGAGDDEEVFGNDGNDVNISRANTLPTHLAPALALTSLAPALASSHILPQRPSQNIATFEQNKVEKQEVD